MTANPHKVAQMKARYWCEVLGHDWSGDPVLDGCNRCGTFKWQPTCKHARTKPSELGAVFGETCLECGCFLLRILPTPMSVAVTDEEYSRWWPANAPAEPQECEDQA